MSESKPPPKKGPAPHAQGTDKKSGRVGFDSRGNPIWEWQIKTGVFGRDVDTKRMKKLEAKDLQIVDQEGKKEQKPGVSGPSVKPRPGGFDPYNSSDTTKGRVLDQLTGAQKPFPPASKNKQSKPKP